MRGERCPCDRIVIGIGLLDGDGYNRDGKRWNSAVETKEDEDGLSNPRIGDVLTKLKSPWDPCKKPGKLFPLHHYLFSGHSTLNNPYLPRLNAAPHRIGVQVKQGNASPLQQPLYDTHFLVNQVLAFE
jgi:hypothetical protein